MLHDSCCVCFCFALSLLMHLHTHNGLAVSQAKTLLPDVAYGRQCDGACCLACMTAAVLSFCLALSLLMDLHIRQADISA